VLGNDFQDKKWGSSPQSEDNHGGAGNINGTLVSLYLILLAFFVVLNSISNQEKNRVAAATESVTRAFKHEHEPKADFVDVQASADAIAPNDEFYDQLKGVFASLIGFEGRFPETGGDVLRIEFSTDDLFYEGTIALRPDQDEFLRNLTTFLKGGRKNERRELSILLYTGDTLPQGPKYWDNFIIQRSGALIAYLQKQGIAEDVLTIGVGKGPRRRLSMTFMSKAVALQDLPAEQESSQPENDVSERAVRDFYISDSQQPELGDRDFAEKARSPAQVASTGLKTVGGLK